jgi:hypothetical protein
MLWRAWSLPRHVQGLQQTLICSGQHRCLATKLCLQSKFSHGQYTRSKPAIRGIARVEISAPLFRAAKLFRDPKVVPTRAEREDIKISGIIRSIRKQKHASFAHISDGSTLAPIQVVLNPELSVGYVINVWKIFINLLTVL